jgi:hypothetical protein
MAVDVREMEALSEEVEMTEKVETLLNKKRDLEAQQAKWEQEFFGLLDKMYTYTDKDKVIGFLNQHREIWEVLLGAPHQLLKYFGAPLRLTMDLFIDPDFPKDKSITVWVGTRLGAQDSIAAQDKFREEWLWLLSDEQTRYILFVDVGCKELVQEAAELE